MRRCLALALLLVSPVVSSATVGGLQPYSATYTVHADGFKVGEMHRSVHRQGDGTWTMESTLYTTGLVALFKKDKIVERSVWKQRSGRPIPLLYHSRYTGRSKEVVEQLDFDWDKGVVTSLRDSTEKDVPLEAGVLDKLSYQIAMRDDLAEGARHLTYRVADRDKIEVYEFEVLGTERLVTSEGELDTLKVRKGTTTFWVAPALDYLVVQIVQKEDHTLSSYITDMKRPSAAGAPRAP